MRIHAIRHPLTTLAEIIVATKELCDDIEWALDNGLYNALLFDGSQYKDHFLGLDPSSDPDDDSTGVSIEFHPYPAISNETIIITSASGSPESVADEWLERRLVEEKAEL